MSYGKSSIGTNPRKSESDRVLDDGSFETAGIAGWMAQRAMQVHPEIEPNLRRTVRNIVGSGFTDQELQTIQKRALDAAEMKDLEVLRGLEAGAPVHVTPSQKARIDRLMGMSGNDDLGRRARGAYEKALKNGQIVVR